jgi:hypothetical protein
MRKLLIIFFWFIGLILNATTYYVAPTGSDAAAGTLVAPWATFQKAIETAEAGDTVYFRGGTFSPTTYHGGSDIFQWTPEKTPHVGHTGTAGARIVFINYPNEVPIIDFSGVTPVTNYNIGLYMESVQYVSFYGLTFQNIQHVDVAGPNVNTIEAIACANLHWEKCRFLNNGGAGYRSFSAMGDLESTYGITITEDTTRIIDCDAFSNINWDGNHADGWKMDQDAGAYFYFYGNRSFFNSDDGFDISGSALRVFVNNWAFGNGNFDQGNGNGFKTAAPRDSVAFSSLIYVNNLSAYNHCLYDPSGGFGFDIVDYAPSAYRGNARFYNNTAYKNDRGFAEFTNAALHYRNDVYRNNIAYASTYQEAPPAPSNVMILEYPYPESHNTWDRVTGGYSFVETDTVTVTDADFVLTDSTTAIAQLMAARNSDGSLPTITFMTLASTSDLINAGTTYGYSEIEDVPGVPAISLSPDIGYAEYAVSGYSINNPYNGVNFSNGKRSALHMHTKESDGDQTVSERIIGDSPPGNVIGFADSTYSILSITDHDSYELDPFLGQFSGVGSTWPWSRYTGLTGLSATTTNIWAVDTSSIYYAGLGSGILAVRGNELTACQQTTGANGLYTHINSYFSSLGYATCPVDNFIGYLDDIKDKEGMAVFNHPGRHTAPASFYNNLFDLYPGVAVGIEIYNAGDYRPIQDPRILWDSINAMRSADSLIWGFSNPDIHQSAYTNDEWKDYNIHFMDDFAESSLRTNMLNGAFTAHWAGALFDDFVEPDQSPTATPRLTGVSIVGDSLIVLTATGCDTIRWIDNTHAEISQNDTLNVSALTTNFVRAELHNTAGGVTYTQPFGISNLSGNTAPLISTVSVNAVNILKGIAVGNVTSDGGVTITDRGICWNTSTNPTTSNSHTHTTGTTGSYTLDIIGLSSNTTYYVRSFATNSEGTSYGANESFTTPVFSGIGKSKYIVR